MTKFQRRLELALSLSGLTAREVAKRANVTEANISQWRKGLAKPRGTDRMMALASALNVSPGWLMGYDGQMQPTNNDAVDLFMSLNEEDKLKAIDYMRYLKTKEQTDVQG